MKAPMAITVPLAFLLVTALGAGAVATDERSVSKYTSTARAKALSYKEDNEEAFGFRAVFAGFGKYRLEHVAGDVRSWINVRFNGRTIDLQSATIKEAGGTFPQKANDVVEWRGVQRNGRFEPYALIYRIETNKDETDQMQTRLIVVKLDGLRSAVIGHAQGANEDADAKRIADSARPR
jgi:hypothetical protein